MKFRIALTSCFTFFLICGFSAVGWAQSPTFTQFTIPTPTSGPFAVTSGPDGAMWFTEYYINKIGRMTTTGTFTEYPIRTAASGPTQITAGSDGAVWFIESSVNQIGRISLSGVVTEYPLPTAQSGLNAITLGPDGAVWFTENLANKIGRISPNGVLNEFTLPTGASGPYGITAGSDGAVWFTETNTNRIGRITSAGIFSEFSVPTALSGLTEITTGPDGALWFIALSTFRIGSMTISGACGVPSSSIIFSCFSLNPIPGSNGHPGGIVAGSDGAVWFLQLIGLMSRVTTAGVFTTYPAPSSDIRSPTSGPDGAIWFTDFINGKIERAAIAGEVALPVVSGAALPAGQTGASYFAQLTATGGTPPYNSWTVVNGALPPGVNLNAATGVVSGTPSFAGTLNFGVSVRDSLGVISAAQNLSITINSPVCTYSLSFGNQAFSSTGGSGSVNVTTLPSCPWIVTGVPSWVNIVSGSGGSGAGSVNFTVAANPTNIAQSATLTIAGLPFIIQEGASTTPIFVGSMPHVVAEGGWNTTFTFVNKSAAAAQTRLNLYDPNDNPMQLPLTLPQQSAIPNTTAVVSQTLAANASLIVQASGPAPQYLEGSAQLSATGTVDGFAIFHFNPSQQEAVVPMETRTASSYLLAFDNTNNVLTGVAIENISSGQSGIPVTIRNDAGLVITQTILTLPANGHQSFVLSTLYPLTTNIRGTIEFDAPPLAKISVLGIRYTPPGTLTTIPALASVSGGLGLFAHLASGGGWQTTFVLINTGGSAAQALLTFYGDNGSSLALPLTFTQTGATSTASSVTQTIAPYSSLWIQGGPAGANLQTGSAQLSTSGSVSGYAIFRYNPNGQEAVAPVESRNAASYIIPFDNTSGTTTGVAVSSVSAQNSIVPVVIRDDAGNQIGTSTLLLNANGHAAFTLSNPAQGFPSTPNIRGTVEFDAPTGARISVLGIRTPPALTFTTLPSLAR